jgi:hypothetical protein
MTQKTALNDTGKRTCEQKGVLAILRFLLTKVQGLTLPKEA